MRESRRFISLVAVGAGLGAIVLVAAFLADARLAWPLLILFALCIAAAVALRRAAESGSEADHTDATPKQPVTQSRPLGDTPEAHDEVSPHDIPLYSPARPAARRQARGLAGTTRGNRQGGAAGRGGPNAGDERLVVADEKDEAQL
jgi:hypothetical protein